MGFWLFEATYNRIFGCVVKLVKSVMFSIRSPLEARPVKHLIEERRYLFSVGFPRFMILFQITLLVLPSTPGFTFACPSRSCHNNLFSVLTVRFFHKLNLVKCIVHSILYRVPFSADNTFTRVDRLLGVELPLLLLHPKQTIPKNPTTAKTPRIT